jgi:L-rhamnose mutarotase
MRRYCLTLDLQDDPQLIREYEAYHQQIWPEITSSIKEAGINNMEIYRFQNRLFMIMEVDESFSFDRKLKMDEQNKKVQEWENLMWRYQKALPGSKEGEKWRLMEKIFQLE